MTLQEARPKSQMKRVVLNINRHDDLKAICTLEETAWQAVESSGGGAMLFKQARLLSQIRLKLQEVQLAHPQPRKRSHANTKRTLWKFERFAREAVAAMETHDQVQLVVKLEEPNP